MSAQAFAIGHLSGVQLDIANVIRSVVHAVIGERAGDNYNNTFVLPSDWDGKFGKESLLVVVHDGGDLAPFVNYDYQRYDLCEKLDEALKEAGFFIEQCTCWYAAVYRLAQ